jgi:hypothetical protein
VKQYNEPVATDTVFSDTPEVHSGITATQNLVHRDKLVANVYGLQPIKEFVNTLEYNVQEQGLMEKLTSDCAKAANINRAKHTLCALCILGLARLIIKTSCNQLRHELFWC